MRPGRKRELVAQTCADWNVSIRRACRVLEFDTSTYHYKSRRRDQAGIEALARDDRPWGGDDPPGVAFTYAPGRSGQYAEDILDGFSGTLQVDGYAGYNRLLKRPAQDVELAYCWAHARRKLHEVAQTGTTPSPMRG